MLGSPIYPLGSVRMVVRDAQEQARTLRDVRGPWVRPRCPSKRDGRKGTRRAWKRRHPPGWTLFYREPTDVLTYTTVGLRYVIVTPWQAAQLRQGIAA